MNQQPVQNMDTSGLLKQVLLGTLYRYESGLDTAGESAAMLFEDWYSALKSGKMTMAEVLHDIVLNFNEKNGNMDLAIDFLQIFTGENEMMDKYRHYNR